jgi:hypothetical protein
MLNLVNISYENVKDEQWLTMKSMLINPKMDMN